MLKTFKMLILGTIVLFLISSTLTGIKGDAIVVEGGNIDRGYYEAFIFLAAGASLLAVIFGLLHIVSINLARRDVRFGIYLCEVCIIVTNLSLIYCDFYALRNNYDWGESTLIWFLAAVPSTALFFLGTGSIAMGWYKEKYNKRKLENGKGSGIDGTNQSL